MTLVVSCAHLRQMVMTTIFHGYMNMDVVWCVWNTFQQNLSLVMARFWFWEALSSYRISQLWVENMKESSLAKEVECSRDLVNTLTFNPLEAFHGCIPWSTSVDLHDLLMTCLIWTFVYYGITLVYYNEYGLSRKSRKVLLAFTFFLTNIFGQPSNIFGRHAWRQLVNNHLLNLQTHFCELQKGSCITFISFTYFT